MIELLPSSFQFQSQKSRLIPTYTIDHSGIIRLLSGIGLA